MNISYLIFYYLICAKAFTTFLNMGIISVRVAGDIPVQSDYLPLITLYFFLSLIYTFISFLWFAIVSFLKDRKYLPSWLNLLLNSIKNKINAFRSESREQKNDACFDKNISILNLIFFTLMLTVMTVSYLIIWIIIST